MSIDPALSMYYLAQLNACDLRMLGQIKISKSVYPYFELLNLYC